HGAHHCKAPPVGVIASIASRNASPRPEMTDQVSAFLAAHGWADARSVHLVGDGSARRYSRLALGERQCLLMECPPAIPLLPFLDVDALLRRLGFSAPEVLAADAAAGLAVLPPFDDARALDGLFRMLDWYWPAMRGAPASDLIRHEFESAWRAVL